VLRGTRKFTYEFGNISKLIRQLYYTNFATDAGTSFSIEVIALILNVKTFFENLRT
jgi:hypothetical protein